MARPCAGEDQPQIEQAVDLLVSLRKAGPRNNIHGLRIGLQQHVATGNENARNGDIAGAFEARLGPPAKPGWSLSSRWLHCAGTVMAVDGRANYARTPILNDGADRVGSSAARCVVDSPFVASMSAQAIEYYAKNSVNSVGIFWPPATKSCPNLLFMC